MLRAIASAALALPLIGCGTTSSHAPTNTGRTTAAVPARSTPATSKPPGALQAEAAQTAAGDIPDNQVFVVYPGKRFTMKFPEGWVQSGGDDNVVFRDKNNIVRVVLRRGARATARSVRTGLVASSGLKISGAVRTVTIGGVPAVKATYVASSNPNAVTGKRVSLTVDRYVLAGGGTQAVVDLGSPVGVDNVDAYRLMINSFRLR